MAPIILRTLIIDRKMGKLKSTLVAVKEASVLEFRS